MLKADKAKLEALTADQLSYSHSDGRVENKDQGHQRRDDPQGGGQVDRLARDDGRGRRPHAVVRHLYVSESEIDGKPKSVRIGALQVWQKQGNDWKLLARAGIKLG